MTTTTVYLVLKARADNAVLSIAGAPCVHHDVTRQFKLVSVELRHLDAVMDWLHDVRLLVIDGFFTDQSTALGDAIAWANSIATARERARERERATKTKRTTKRSTLGTRKAAR